MAIDMIYAPFLFLFASQLSLATIDTASNNSPAHTKLKNLVTVTRGVRISSRSGRELPNVLADSLEAEDALSRAFSRISAEHAALAVSDIQQLQRISSSPTPDSLKSSIIDKHKQLSALDESRITPLIQKAKQAHECLIKAFKLEPTSLDDDIAEFYKGLEDFRIEDLLDNCSRSNLCEYAISAVLAISGPRSIEIINQLGRRNIEALGKWRDTYKKWATLRRMNMLKQLLLRATAALEEDDEAAIDYAIARKTCSQDCLKRLIRREVLGESCLDDLTLVADWFSKLNAIDLPKRRARAATNELGMLINTLSPYLQKVAPQAWNAVESARVDFKRAEDTFRLQNEISTSLPIDGKDEVEAKAFDANASDRMRSMIRYQKMRRALYHRIQKLVQQVELL